MIIYKLQELLDEVKLSQRRFSELSGVRYATINKICKNEMPSAPLETLDKIIETLDCEISDLMVRIKEQPE